jgi:diketogulonate reductase-like aldo/keto reductase
VAAAIDRGLVARAELFLQTKFTSVDGQDERLPYDARAPVGEQVAQSFASSLEHLHTDYLDSYVLHGPSRSIGLGDDDWQAWRAIGDLQRDGRTRLVGVSNVSGDQLAELWRGTEVKPAFVQNRCYARDGWDAQVRAFCRDHDIAYQGFSLLTANRRELASTTVRALAARLRCTVPQLVFAFARTIGIIPLTGSSDRGHLAEDLDSLELVLDDGDVEAVASLAATALSR